MTDEMDDILEEIETIDLDDPSFDLDEPEFDRGNFNPWTPVNKINGDLRSFKNKFTIAHINARSLNKNIEELREIIYKTNFDAVAISETWLTKNTPHDRFELNHFSIFRNDRTSKRGGGVLWYIRDHYKAKVIKTLCSDKLPEMLWIEVFTGGKKLALGCLYKPPKIPYGVFANLYDSLMAIYVKYEHTVLLGDFNVNMLELNAYSTKFLLDAFIEPFTLKQLINEPTRISSTSRTLIDLILVSKPENALFSSVCDAPGVSDHCFTYVAYRL
jgi:exonuclease III